MKKILFVLLVLAGVLTAGCITSPQIPPGCGGLQTDEECEASLSTTPAPTGSNLVVKSEQVAATPVATEAMVTTASDCSKLNWKKEELKTVNVDGLTVEKIFNSATTLCDDGVLVVKAVVREGESLPTRPLNGLGETFGKGSIQIIEQNKANRAIRTKINITELNPTPEVKYWYPVDRIYGGDGFGGIPAKQIEKSHIMPETLREFKITVWHEFQTPRN